MTKITKTVITFVITLTLFAAMSANAFASVNTTGWTAEQIAAYRADQAEAAKFKRECGINADKAHREMIAELLPYGYYFEMCNTVATNDARIKDVAYIVTQILEDTDVVLPYYIHCSIDGLYKGRIKTLQLPNMIDTGLMDESWTESSGKLYDGVTVKGDKLATREQLVITLARAVNYRGMNGNGVTPVINDIDKFTTEEGKEAAKLIVGYGFLNLDANGNFNPQTNATGNDLIEVAVRMHRYMKDVPLPQYVIDRNAEVKAVQIID